MQSARFNPNVLQQIAKKGKFSSGVVITFQVMAVAGMSPGNPDTVGTATKSSQNKLRADAAGAGNPDYPYIWGVLKTAYACKVGRPITAPVTEEGSNLR